MGIIHNACAIDSIESCLFFQRKCVFISNKERLVANLDDARPFSDLFLPDLKGIVIGMQLIFLETGASNFIPIRELFGAT